MQIGIKRTFHLFSAVTAILPIIFIGLISLFIMRNQLIKGVDESSVTLAHSIANQIATYLKEPDATFNFLGNHLSGQQHSQAALSGLLDNLTDAYSYFESVYLLDKDGIVREVGFEKGEQLKKIDYRGMDFSSLEICQRALSEKRFQWQSTLSVTSGEPSISFCAPLADGSILATLKLSRLGRIINKASASRAYDAFIVDRRGRIITHPDQDVVSRQENISNLPIIREALAGKTSSGTFEFRTTAYRGSAVTIEGFDWILVVAQNYDAAMAPVKALETIYLAGICATLLLTLIASSVASSVLSKPFSQLSSNAYRVIDEDYDRIKPISSRLLEITLLSETLDKMVDAVKTREALLNEQTEELMSTEESLREANQNLEQRVAERTAKLEEAKEEMSLLNEDLLQRTLALEDANRHLESFAYSISHDLRAPLRHVSGFATIISEEYAEALNDTGKDYLRRMVRACQRMEELINAILEFSRVARQSLNRSEVDIDTMVRELLVDLQAENGGRTIETVVGTLPRCNVDRLLFRQVLVNLLGNAFKYTRHREVARIEIGSERQGDELLFYIRDNGAGFDMQYGDKLFGVFQRFHRQEDFEGIGVGLAIVHSIIQRHGGRIWAEAKPDEGATFRFTLPAE